MRLMNKPSPMRLKRDNRAGHATITWLSSLTSELLYFTSPEPAICVAPIDRQLIEPPESEPEKVTLKQMFVDFYRFKD